MNYQVLRKNKRRGKCVGVVSQNHILNKTITVNRREVFKETLDIHM